MFCLPTNILTPVKFTSKTGSCGPTRVVSALPLTGGDRLTSRALDLHDRRTLIDRVLDECPAVSRSLDRADGSSPVLRVTTELELFSENAQIAWAEAFLESLPERLIG